MTPPSEKEKLEDLLRLTHAAGKLCELFGKHETINTEKVEDMLNLYEREGYIERIFTTTRRRVITEIRNRLKDYVHKFESEFINGEDMLAIEWKDLEKILTEVGEAS